MLDSVTHTPFTVLTHLVCSLLSLCCLSKPLVSIVPRLLLSPLRRLNFRLFVSPSPLPASTPSNALLPLASTPLQQLSSARTTKRRLVTSRSSPQSLLNLGSQLFTSLEVLIATDQILTALEGALHNSAFPSAPLKPPLTAHAALRVIRRRSVHLPLLPPVLQVLANDLPHELVHLISPLRFAPLPAGLRCGRMLPIDHAASFLLSRGFPGFAARRRREHFSEELSARGSKRVYRGCSRSLIQASYL